MKAAYWTVDCEKHGIPDSRNLPNRRVKVSPPRARSIGKALVIGLALSAGIAQAQDVRVMVGKSYVIPYVVNEPGAAGVGIQVNATHNMGLSLGLATNVVLPSDSAAGAYAAYSDHYNRATGLYYFVALSYAMPADSGILPIRVLARRAGEYELKVRQCYITRDEHTKADCALSITRIVAEDIAR